MIFKTTEPDVNFGVLKLESEQWELGLTQFMFGRRVRLSRKGAQVCDIDYCAGADEGFQKDLLVLVRVILLPLPETVDRSVVQAMFPQSRIKPVNLDEELMEQLREQAVLALEPAHEKVP